MYEEQDLLCIFRSLSHFITIIRVIKCLTFSNEIGLLTRILAEKELIYYMICVFCKNDAKSLTKSISWNLFEVESWSGINQECIQIHLHPWNKKGCDTEFINTNLKINLIPINAKFCPFFGKQKKLLFTKNILNYTKRGSDCSSAIWNDKL